MQTFTKIIIDPGAEQALLNGNSLLAVGITQVAGEFSKGDAVSVIIEQREVARGLVNYPGHELRQILGQHSESIANILGYQGANTVMHRDNLVILNRGGAA